MEIASWATNMINEKASKQEDDFDGITLSRSTRRGKINCMTNFKKP